MKLHESLAQNHSIRLQAEAETPAGGGENRRRSAGGRRRGGAALLPRQSSTASRSTAPIL